MRMEILECPVCDRAVPPDELIDVVGGMDLHHECPYCLTTTHTVKWEEHDD